MTYFWIAAVVAGLVMFFALLGHVMRISTSLARLVELVEGEAEIAIQEQAARN